MEIELNQFKDWWSSLDMVVKGFGAQWDNQFQGDQPMPKFSEQEVIPLDIPHLALEPYETTFLSGPHEWLLEDDVFLLTPRSSRWAVEKLSERYVRCTRGSMHFEACDWRHVEREQETITGLLNKIKQANIV